VLELGKAGSAGTDKGVQPVLREGSVIVTIRTSNCKEAATATIGAQPWVLAKNERELTARWEGTHRYLIAGRTVAGSGTTRGWSPRPTLTAEADLPVHHQVFLLWVELILGRRAAAVAAAV
jgi:hypothetical protein